MIDQSNSNFFGDGIVQRKNPTGYTPGGIKQTAFSSDFIQDTSTFVSGANTLTNNSALVIQSIIASTTNSNIKLAANPYSIVFFEGSLSTSNIIGSGILNTGYIFNGPFSMPIFTPNAQNFSGSTVYGGSNGNNIVYVTTLINTTGVTKTIYYITNTRVVQSGGGAGASV